MEFLTLFAVMIIAKSTKNAPKLPASVMVQLETNNEPKIPPKRLDPKIKRATPRLAPEEIPRTKGPAKGFLNKVCINRPLIDKPDPTIIAVIAFGSR